MGHTFSNVLVHVIFGTKGRKPTIDRSFQERLHAYMAGLAQSEFGLAKQIGGTDNHVHGLLQIRPDVSVAHAMSRRKSLSSGWVHQNFPSAPDFAWQRGYAAFSVSPSRAGDVAAYIQRQAEHHATKTFEQEFTEFLDRHGVAHVPGHVWD